MCPGKNGPLGISRMNPSIGRAQHLIRSHGERHVIGHDVHDLSNFDGHHFHDRGLDAALAFQRPQTAPHLHIPRLQALTDHVHRLLAGQPVPHRHPP